MIQAWEYRRVKLERPEDMDGTLSEYGRNGWELAGWNIDTVIFKRPKDEPKQPAVTLEMWKAMGESYARELAAKGKSSLIS